MGKLISFRITGGNGASARQRKSGLGLTCFRVYGTNDSEQRIEIEASEVREALAGLVFLGNERTGGMMLNLVLPQSLQRVFVEDSQATIKILEKGKSSTFSHTDKTQRLNLSWLESNSNGNGTG